MFEPDPARIALWESETLQGMRLSPDFVHRRDKQVRLLSEEIQRQLIELLPNSTPDAMHLFHQEIIGKTVALASTIRCSSRQYYLDFGAKVGAIYPNDLKDIHVRAVHSGRALKPEDMRAGGDDSPVAYGVLVIQPALLLRRPDIGDRVLQKPVVLAISYIPVGPEERRNAEAREEAERKRSAGDKPMDVFERLRALHEEKVRLGREAQRELAPDEAGEENETKSWRGASGAEDVLEKLLVQYEEEIRAAREARERRGMA